MDTESTQTPPKIFISFPFKLMLIMTCVVALVALAAMFIMQNQFNKSYSFFLANQFENQVNIFQKKQEVNRRSIRDAVDDATSNPRILAAFSSDEIAFRFYTDMEFQLQRVLYRYWESKYSETSEATPFFRFVYLNGDMLQPTEDTLELVGLIADEKVETQLTAIARKPIEDESLGYCWKQNENQKSLYEILIIPILDKYTDADKQYRGNLVFGVPMENYTPDTISSQQSIQNALYVDGGLWTQDFEQANEQPIMNALDKTAINPNERPILEMNDESFQIYQQRLRIGEGFPPVFQLSLFSLKEQESLNEEIKATFLTFILAALIVAILLSFVVAHRITQPILEIEKGTQKVKAGDFDIHIPVRSRDEIGRLSASFNGMTIDLATKEKYRNVLNLVTDEKVASALLSGDIELGGEKLTATILFCDIRGFTSLTDGMDPLDVVQFVNKHMTAMTKVVRKHYGIVDKFVGDEIMVLFGPLSSEERNDALDAVQCALAMIEERERLNQATGEAIHIGIGIATGKVVAGRMGSEDRLEYTVLGDKVNLASRLCSRARPMEVLLDRETQACLGAQVKNEEFEKLSLKGFTEPVPVFKAMG